MQLGRVALKASGPSLFCGHSIDSLQRRKIRIGDSESSCGQLVMLVKCLREQPGLLGFTLNGWERHAQGLMLRSGVEASLGEIGLDDQTIKGNGSTGAWIG